MLDAAQVSRLTRALPFWLSLSLVPVVLVAATFGGWTLILPPLAGWYLVAALDFLLGNDRENADPRIAEASLFWYRLVTLIWFPIQFVVVFGLIGYAGGAVHLSGAEKVLLFVGVGVLSGLVGINFSHELMHRTSRLDRWLADLLLAMVLYSHFRSEHLLVHHVHVGTPRDTVTARYNEGFHRYFARVLWQGHRSAWRAEAARLARAGRSAFDGANPFWHYWALKGGFVLLALIVGGWVGLGLFLVQALVAVWQLELVNYVEHYGLTRKRLANGKFEPAAPHHSWNADRRASNWLLINLQRHSDHHYRPSRPYPLLQTYADSEAPQLPYGYPTMGLIAMWPRAWRRLMNPRVRKWRAMFYPEINDWFAAPATKKPPH